MRAAVALGLISFAALACSSYRGDTPVPPPSDAGAEAGSVCTDRVVYVATTGDDTNDGCDEHKPKRTLSSALGAIQAKGAANTEVRTCAETLRERVVLAYPASIVGGFACGTWTAGAGRTTIEAPDDKEVETVIAFGASVSPTVKLEHLEIVGPTRPSGAVSALRIKDGASPLVKDDEIIGGETKEGYSVALAIEGKSSPTIEDSTVRGGRAHCKTTCVTAISSGVTIDGGAPRIRRTHIDGGSADVEADDSYVGSVALDVLGAAKATGDDAFTDLEIIPGIARIATTAAAYGLRVQGQSEIDLARSKILAAAEPSTCIASPCSTFALDVTNSVVRVSTTRVESTPAAGAPGTTGVTSRERAVVARPDSMLSLSSVYVRASGFAALDATRGATVDVRASTLVGNGVIANNGATVDVRGSLLAHVQDSGSAINAFACPSASKTTLDATLIVSAAPFIATFYSGSPCAPSASFGRPSDAASGSTTDNGFTSTNSDRTICSGTPEDCLKTVFATLDDAKLKDGVACSIAQGGLGFADVPNDLYGAPRTTPFSMGAHEYDGTCK